MGGKADVRHGLGRDELPDGLEAEGDIRAVMTSPLLLTYLLSGEERGPSSRGLDGKMERGEAKPFREGMLLPALSLHFPGEPDPDRERPIKYRLNRVAQRELFGPDEGDDTTVDDDIEDDD